MKKILHEPLFYLLPLLILAYLIATAEQEVSDVKLTRNNVVQNIELPYSINMEQNEIFFVSFNLFVKNKSVKLNLIPDDCLQEILINGKKFPLDGIKKLCDYGSGVYLDFSKYLQEGLNHFELRIMNRGGPAGLRIGSAVSGFKSLFLSDFVFVLLFLFSLFLILKKFKFQFIAASIILLGIIARLILYTYTGPMQNAHDIDGHFRYTQVVSEEKRIPKIDECKICYQPPLYYITTAVVKNIADSYNPNLTDRFLQQWNLLLSFACVILGVALILNLFGNCWTGYLAALVSVLWPGFVLTAPRINNDILFYFGALFCMLFVQRYWRLYKKSDVLLASIGAAIALSAKSNGFVILGVWVIIYILATLRSFKMDSLRVLIISIVIIILSIGLSNHRSIINIFDGKKVELIGGINTINTMSNAVHVKNTMGNYLYLDLKDYFLEPYVSAWIDAGGRQYFWNYAIKTSLFGEFRLWDSHIGRVFATTLATLALFIFLLALWGIIHAKFKDLPPLLFIMFLFAALIYLRVSYPYSCSNDFRYIFPVLFPIVYFATCGVQILQDSRLRKLSYIGMLAFAALSFAFIVGKAI